MNTTIILSIFFVGICVAGICIKILIQKDGKFSGKYSDYSLVPEPSLKL